MSADGKAVFLSYASQDAEAAKRIADALRGAGVEVWFDAEGGLEHGDEWDAKIRRQIKECVLFIPIISANTQAREEGYFRLEWDMAAERARSIASGVPFILPVVIDGTRDAGALVPDRFRSVQWTRLPGGEVPPDVLQRFLKLWSHRTGVLKHQAEAAAATVASGSLSTPPAGPARSRSLAIAVVVGALLAVGLWFGLSKRDASPVAAAPAPSGPREEAARLIAQARELVYDPDSARAEFTLAESLLKRALELAPDSSRGWAVSALLNHYFYRRGYDGSKARLARSASEADRALRLAPEETDALFALGLHRQMLGEVDRAQVFLERALRADPRNPRILIGLAFQKSSAREAADQLEIFVKQTSAPAELHYYIGNRRTFEGRLTEARAASERALAIRPFWRVYVQQAHLEYLLNGDPRLMLEALDRVPEAKRDEPRVAFVRYLAARLQGDGLAAVRALESVPVDYFSDNYYAGPKSYLLAQAYELKGDAVRARDLWLVAERDFTAQLAEDPSLLVFRAALANVHAALGRHEKARAVLAECAADAGYTRLRTVAEDAARAWIRLGEPDRAVAALLGAAGADTPSDISALILERDIGWAPLRASADYPRLLQRLRERDPVALAATPAPAAPDKKSIAVLPFVNLGADKSDEYLGDGMTEELLSALAKVKGLRVPGRSSSFAFKGRTDEDLFRQVAAKLRVSTVLEGSVRKVGDKLRIAVQLIDCADGTQLWSEEYDRSMADLLAVQAEVAQQVVRKLRVALGVEESRAFAKKPTENPEAYRLYLLGRHQWSQNTETANQRALKYFEEALRLDPTFTLAYCGLADCYGWVGGGFMSGRAAWERGTAMARKALELDPELADAHLSLGIALASRYDWRAGEQAMLRAIELNPNLPLAHDQLGWLRRLQGRFDEAISESKQALELDPLSLVVHHTYARSLAFSRRYDEAIAFARRTVELNPAFGGAHDTIGWCLLFKGDRAGALAEFQRSLALDDGPGPRGALGYYYGITGDRAKAEEILRGLEELSRQRFVTPEAIMTIYVGLGDKDRAFEWLERCYEQQDPGCWTLKINPIFDPLRSDPRFQALLKKVGFDQ